MCCQEEEGDPPIVPGLGTRTDSTLLFSTTTRFCIGVEFHLSRGGGGGGRLVNFCRGGARAPEPPVLYAYALLHLLNSANLSAARKS